MHPIDVQRFEDYIDVQRFGDKDVTTIILAADTITSSILVLSLYSISVFLPCRVKHNSRLRVPYHNLLFSGAQVPDESACGKC
jgi:hypothetical protein